MRLPIYVRLKRGPLLFYLAYVGQGIHLVSPAVRKYGFVPTYKLVQPPRLLQHVKPRAQIQMVSISQNNLRLNIVLQFALVHCLYRSRRAHRHKYGGVNNAVAGSKFPCPCLGTFVGCCNLKKHNAAKVWYLCFFVLILTAKQLSVTLIIFYVFIAATAVQLFYFLFFFVRILFARPVIASCNKGVSVVVAAHNEYKNLIKLIPALLNQDYPDFEIIITNDRSTDKTLEVLDHYPTIKVITINSTPKGINPKKYALTKAIECATKEVILLTDADCLPLSNRWIKSMAEGFTEGKEIVLGYSPYEEQPYDFLNELIRYETFYTGVQYLSFALAGFPYMGVGRNLAYKKELFVKNNGFKSHEGITGGDDDLLINEVATKTNVGVVFSPQSRVVSYPKDTYKGWISQKTRHLSAGRHYKFKNKVLIGVLAVSLVLFYLGTVYFSINNYSSPFIITLFLFRTSVLICSFAFISRKLGDNFNPLLFPVLDFVYAINYIFLGIRALRKNDNKWM